MLGKTLLGRFTFKGSETLFRSGTARPPRFTFAHLLRRPRRSRFPLTARHVSELASKYRDRSRRKRVRSIRRRLHRRCRRRAVRVGIALLPIRVPHILVLSKRNHIDLPSEDLLFAAVAVVKY